MSFSQSLLIAACALATLNSFAAESPAGKAFRAKLDPQLPSKRQYYLFAGKEAKGGACFLRIDNTPTNVLADVSYASELNLHGSDKKLTLVSLSTDSQYDNKNAIGQIKDISNGYAVQEIEKDGSDVATKTLQLVTKPGAKNYSGITDARATSSRKYPEIPSLQFSIARECRGMSVLAAFDEDRGQKLADAAAQRWNTQNPTKRQTGEVMFLSCNGYSANTFECDADGEGQGDGDEPVLTFRYSLGADGKFQLSYVHYYY